MEIEFERDTPHAIADAIIAYKMSFVREDYTRLAMIEDIRMIGKALTDFAESCDRIDKRLTEQTDCPWK